MKIYFLNKFQTPILLGFIFCTCSYCEHEYHYLSENDKQYLLYDLGDILMFVSESDTIYGQVDEKHFWTTSNGVFGTEHFEIGSVHIRNLFDTVQGIANIDVSNYGDKVTYDIIIFIANFDSSIAECMNPLVPYNALLINGELFQYNNEKQSTVKMEPVSEDIYEFNYVHENCPDEMKSTLHLSKTIGLKMIIIKDSDSIKISVR